MFGSKDNRGHNVQKGKQGFQPVRLTPLEAPTAGVGLKAADLAGASSSVQSDSRFAAASDKFKKRGPVGKVLKTLGAAGGAVGLALLLSACSASTLNSGTVSELNHTNAYTSYYMSCTGVKIKTCHTVPMFHPEAWDVTISATDNHGETQSRVIPVSEAEYGQIKVGQSYTLTDAQVKAGEDSAALGNNLLIGGGIAAGVGAAVIGGIAIKRRVDDRNYRRQLYGD